MNFSSYIQQSKLRCKELGMIETSIPYTEILNPIDFSRRLTSYKEIILIANFFLQKLFDSMQETPMLFGVSDQDAYLLSINSNAPMKNTIEQLGIQEGVCFIENNVGTNVMNLSIRHRMPFQVIGEDHYHHFLHTYACYAVPFYSIEDNKLLGTIGIFTTTSNAHPCFLSLLTIVVDSIERELLLRKNNVQLSMLNQVLLESNDSCVMITDNISEMKNKEKLLRNAEKLAAVGQLAAGVAHEIRNPLAIVKGFMQLVQDKFEQPSYYNLVISELDRINLIIEEFLVLGKPLSTLYKDVDCSVLLKEIVTIFESQALMNDIIIHFDYLKIGIIEGDPNRIKQVFINIFKNAMEAMPYGGNLFIQMDIVDGNQIIRFIDEGEGIDDEMLSKLGQPFASTKSYGNGLGIMVSRKIVESHKGNLNFKSKVGKGTTVELSFPIRI